MGYSFSEDKFIASFNAKSIEEKSADSFRLTHKLDSAFKLFPYKATGKQQAPIVTNLEDIVSTFFREIQGEKTEPVNFDSLCEAIIEEVEIDDEDLDYFRDVLQSLFFSGNDFVANNLGLYPYQTVSNNKSADNLAHYLYSVLGLDEEDYNAVETAKSQYHFNVLEDMVIQTMERKKISESEGKEPYFSVKSDIQKKFREDFHFMLNTGMISLEDFSNLFSVYYFYYVSQVCITLDRFCDGRRDDMVEFFYALDWEKVSKNRMCCVSGWDRLQASVAHMFSHAITLEIINQTGTEKKWDYIAFSEYLEKYPEEDHQIAEEIIKAEKVYCSYVGDYKRFDEVGYYKAANTETEKAIRHLFKCVEAQFLNTERRRVNQVYNEKFSEFCKYRWIKNRKKSGLVLNLTERDIIFLTKISLRDKEKIRLNDLYKEYEFRGIYLDNSSKEYLQEFFTKLNLIDKKSDSGDAQYVKRIL